MNLDQGNKEFHLALPCPESAKNTLEQRVTGKHLCRKVVGWSSASLLKETSMFSSEFCEILESTVFIVHLLATSFILCCESGYWLIIAVETKILDTFRLDFREPL